METPVQPPKKTGCGPLLILIIVIIMFAGIFGLKRAMKTLNSVEEVPLNDDQKKTVVDATGAYTYKDYTVNITMHIPLSGGPVSGTVSDVCDGSVSGTFDGKDNGAIAGKIAGTCSPFFVPVPATATFAGTVNKETKKVIINFLGKGAGFSHSDSMTLSY